jgi:hypothetical protein
VTITWSIGVGRSWKNDCGEAGSLASRAAVRCASSSSAACLRCSFIAPGEDEAGALCAGAPGGFQPYAGAAADDDGLAEQFKFALGGYGSGSDGHDFPPADGAGDR